MKPLIGITPSSSEDTLGHGTFLRYHLSANYADAVLAAGGVPLVLPPQLGHAESLLDVVDGLLLSGGGDVDPARYGDPEHHPNTYGVDDLRDRFELELIEEALRRDLPTLCICRGLQVLNVGLGGTLVQDVATQHPPAAFIPGHHRQHDAGVATGERSHPVALAPNTPLRDRDSADRIAVNSFHHQAVKDLAPGLVVAAESPDGLIEAAYSPAHAFVAGVQWHPEMLFDRHPEHLRPFVALVDAALARRAVPTGV